MEYKGIINRVDQYSVWKFWPAFIEKALWAAATEVKDFRQQVQKAVTTDYMMH